MISYLSSIFFKKKLTIWNFFSEFSKFKVDVKHSREKFEKIAPHGLFSTKVSLGISIIISFYRIENYTEFLNQISIILFEKYYEGFI